jgi:hypothetical protein
VEAQLIQAETWTDMMKLFGAFREYAIAPQTIDNSFKH